MKTNIISISIIAVVMFLTLHCTIPQQTSVFVPVGVVAKVNSKGEMFGLRAGEVPFADSSTSINLYKSARGVEDMKAVEAMVRSGRVVFLPVGAFVDVLEHNENEATTKVRIRSGENIGREMWTHPIFISPLN